MSQNSGIPDRKYAELMSKIERNANQTFIKIKQVEIQENLMTAQESKILRIQLYHPFMGVHNFDINSKENFIDLRMMLSQHTQMTIFENFRFEAYGKLLLEFQEIGQVINKQTRINLVIQPFDQRSSYYHYERIREILSNPIQWVMLNSREVSQQKQQPDERLPENITIDNFLESHLTSTLYQSSGHTDKHISFLQQMNFSIHNPPPMHRKLAGDFYYLQIKTLQGHEEHVTACPVGFYVNNSTNSVFNTVNSSGIYFYNLLDLLKYLSPKFKETFNGLRKMIHVTELEKSIFSSYKLRSKYNWLKNSSQFSHKKQKYNQWRYFTFDNQNDSAFIKDWNQLIQMNSVLPGDTEIEIANKQKSQYKLYQQFVAFAKQAAVKAIQSRISSKNKQISLSQRVFSYGSISVSFIEDDTLSYSTRENGKLTRRAINAELRNLEMLQNNKQSNFNLKHTVLINYKGYDVVVETVVPAASVETHQMFNRNSKHQKDEKVIEQISKALRLQFKNLYRTQANEVERGLVHPELHSIKCQDSRCYVLNLHSVSVHDLSFPSSKNTSCYLRRELIQIFNQKQNCHRLLNSMIGSDYALIGSERIAQQHMKLNSIKTYAEQIMVPLCIQAFLKGHKKHLADSKTVVKVMHKFGLSSRYLGVIHKKAAFYDATHIRNIIQRVTLVKTLKGIFRQALRRTELGDVKCTICRLLNCIFFADSKLITVEQVPCKEDAKDQISTNASRKKKKKLDSGWEPHDDHVVIKINQQLNQAKPSDLWQQIKQVAQFRYGLKFTESKIQNIKCLEHQFSKYALLRDLCINLGVVLSKVDYFKKEDIIFRPEHIEEMYPLIKHINYKNRYLEALTQEADSLIAHKRVQQAIDTYNQAINFATTNYGIITQELAALNKKVAEIYFRIGEIEAALMFINCAQKMYEKIYGESHVQTLQCYSLVSHFNFSIRNFATAEYYLMKNIHISTVSYGQQYPQLIVTYLNLSTLYEASLKFMDSITCISHALRIVLRVHGQQHLSTAICYAAMSTAHFEIPDIEKSIFFQQKCIQILKMLFKPEDSRLKQAQKLLQYYHNLQSTKKVKQTFQKQKKKLIISNPQLFAGFPLFRVPEFNNKDQQLMFRKMHHMMQYPGRYFI